MESEELFDVDQLHGLTNDLELQPNELQPSQLAPSEEYIQQWNNTSPPSVGSKEWQESLKSSSEQPTQYFDNLFLPLSAPSEQPLMDSTLSNHPENPSSLPVCNLLDLNLAHLVESETQTWRMDSSEQQQMFTQISSGIDTYAPDIQQTPSQPLQAYGPPMLPVTDSRFLTIDNGQNSIESSSTFSFIPDPGAAIEDTSLDFSLVNSPSLAANPLQIGSFDHTGSYVTSFQPDISSTVADTYPSLSSPIISSPTTSILQTPVPDISQNLSLAQFKDHSSMRGPNKGKRKNRSPEFGPQAISKRKNCIPRDMINCIKFPLSANSRLKETSDETKQRPCLICRMHKKRCAGGYPCNYCEERIRQAVGKRLDQNVKFTGCVESDLGDLNVFLDEIKKTVNRSFESSNAKVNTSTTEIKNGLKKVVTEILSNRPFGYLRDNSNMIGRKPEFDWMDRIGWYLVKQTPSFKFFMKLIQEDMSVDILGWASDYHYPKEWTYPQQPSASKISMLDSESVNNKFRVLVWAATFIHRKTIGKFLNVHESHYALLLLVYSIQEEVAIESRLRARRRASEQKSDEAFVISSLSAFSGVMFSKTNWLDEGERDVDQGCYPPNEAKIEHFYEFCKYYIFRDIEKFGPAVTLLSHIYFRICQEIGYMDLSGWKSC